MKIPNAKRIMDAAKVVGCSPEELLFALQKHKESKGTLTREQARAIVEAHEIRLEEGDEETDLLRENNPTLYDAYKHLLASAE